MKIAVMILTGLLLTGCAARRVRLTGGRHCGVGGNVGSNPARGG